MIQKLFITVVIVLGVYFAFNFFSNQGGDIKDGGSSINDVSTQVFAAKTVSEMRSIQSALEILFVETGSYPRVGEMCQSALVLQEELVPYYMGNVPDAGIQAAVSNDGFSFVLRAKLSYTSTILLSNDADGQILGCDCNDPFFCLKEYTVDPDDFYEKYGEEF